MFLPIFAPPFSTGWKMKAVLYANSLKLNVLLNPVGALAPPQSKIE
jgi:hypothetical protein